MVPVTRGGALHLHSISLTTIDWVIKNITYMSNLYYCVSSDEAQSLRFEFFCTPPKVAKPSCSMWQNVSAARVSFGEKNFDEWLFTKMTMWTDEDPLKVYPNSTAAWTKFQSCFFSINDLTKDANVFEMYLWQALSEFMEDNVQYMEMRSVIQQLTTTHGTLYPIEYTMQLFAKTVDRFVATYPCNFSGAKLISSPQREVPRETVKASINLALKLRDSFPDHFAGFDLVGEEDTGYPLFYYINELLIPSQTNRSLPYFFHAGETDWEGTAIDDNLIDALLLNTSRIGHGYAITKHPVAMEMAKSKGIALEINPISNQVLHLVGDLRNHPAATLVSQGFPLVISSDDSPIWCSDPLSFDFYETFMGLAGAKADLATLKQLAQDSIRYSVMTSDEKHKALALWDKKWQAFLDEVLMI
ncbi:adenosine deaminase 2-like isoform X2 [Asterias amurensis]|uniref:adenosine deaminase 2-like isoform X2 n=1 Tax=Asterias amurensis TaxID=7602 RepID=UPI003AB48E11